ncbi:MULTISPECIES: hypothetical protein [Actinosynnema]|uniref:hypothetical protein n=1 Tax=Actinosynnema TaxID=40566 RepID=UPI0020A3C134|nr:hypothetical protein [Actinosynnema pretiosum]
MAADAVHEGFELFTRLGIVGRQWTPESGLSLLKYFENACVLSFPNVCRRWRRSRRDWKDDCAAPGWQPARRSRKGIRYAAHD